MRFLLALLALLMLSAVMTDAAPSQQIFVTNTPAPPDPLRAVPDAAVDQYALRLWTEPQLINVLTSQLERLVNGDTAQEAAIRYTLYELERRFPQAPRSQEQRAALLDLMLAAPRGALDKRSIVRPYLVLKMDERISEINPNTENTLTIDNFLVQTVPFNLNGDDEPDALVTVRYPAEAVTPEEIRYKDFWLAEAVAENGFRLPPSSPSLPAAPFNEIEDIQILRADDVNGDTLDELAITVDRGGLNDEILIYGWRNGQVSSLVAPDQSILYGEFIDWDSPTLNVAQYRQESERWDCISRLPVQWRWETNFYRLAEPLNPTYSTLGTVGCALHRAEPIFSRPFAEGIEVVSAIVNDGGLNPTGTNAGGMALAMLYLLDGQRSAAEEQTASLLQRADSDPELAQQIDIFASTAGQDDVSPAEVCAALLFFDQNGPCNMDQVIERILRDTPIPRESDLEAQLEARGLPVLEIVTVSQIGRADRQVVNFNLIGSSWWAFAPTDPVAWVSEITEPPVAFADATLPAALIQPPAAAYEALFERNDPVRVLTVLENALLQNPDAPFSAEARFMQALSYDLSGDRPAARQAYYNLWVEFSSSAWGQLAGAHLERR